MYRNVFGVSKRAECTLINEEALTDWLIPTVTDYVTPVPETTRNDEIDCFTDQMLRYEDVEVSERNGYRILIFKDGFKKNFLLRRFNKIKQLVLNTDKTEYLQDPCVFKATVENYLGSRFGTYVSDDGEVVQLSSWLENVEENVPYYVGDAFYYHV